MKKEKSEINRGGDEVKSCMESQNVEYIDLEVSKNCFLGLSDGTYHFQKIAVFENLGFAKKKLLRVAKDDVRWGIGNVD